MTVGVNAVKQNIIRNIFFIFFVLTGCSICREVFNVSTAFPISALAVAALNKLPEEESRSDLLAVATLTPTLAHFL